MRKPDVTPRAKPVQPLPVVVALAVMGALAAAPPAAAQEMALAGQISSAQEGAMEGVVVSARKDGSPVTVSVVSDAQGRFSFPPAKLQAGHYTLGIRAVGYALAAPVTVEVGGGRGASLAITLRQADDLAAQLSNAEWMASLPGTDEQKLVLDRCVSCHTLAPVLTSTGSARRLIPILQRMTGYAPGSTLAAPKLLVRAPKVSAERVRPLAEYLASVNLSRAEPPAFPLRTLPRPSGRATRVVITEYDLPRANAQPHDVILNADGMAWYTDFGQQVLGRLDPRTGTVTEYPVPLLKPGFPPGLLDLQADRHGNLWIGMMLQGGIAKFDRKTATFELFRLPPEIDSDSAQLAMVMPGRSDVDGKVWMNSGASRAVHRLDLASRTFETFAPYASLPKGQDHSVYGINADSHNNLFFMDFRADNIGRIDAATGKVTLYKTPTPGSNPRRGTMDAQDRLWFAEYRANKLAMFDTRTERFQEWALPTRYSFPYDVMPDRNGELWTAGMSSDRVIRFDPKTGATVEYLLPRPTNVRRVFVDNTTTPVAIWIGNNHGASVVKVEPLD